MTGDAADAATSAQSNAAYSCSPVLAYGLAARDPELSGSARAHAALVASILTDARISLEVFDPTRLMGIIGHHGE